MQSAGSATPHASHGDADDQSVVVPSEPEPKRPRVVGAEQPRPPPSPPAHDRDQRGDTTAQAGGGDDGPNADAVATKTAGGGGGGGGAEAGRDAKARAEADALEQEREIPSQENPVDNNGDESSVVHSIRHHDPEIMATVSDAVAYLDTLASQAEDSKMELTSEIGRAFDDLQSFMQMKLARNIAKLKAKAQKNLTSSLVQLKTLNTANFKGKQRLFYPQLRVHNVLDNAFSALSCYIFVVQGTHILDLPISVLGHIMQYLPPTSLIVARAVCFKFWKYVCEVTRTDKITLSTDVQREKHDGGFKKYLEWKLVGGNTLVTPTGDFRFKVTSSEKHVCVQICLAESKLFAQPKSFKIVVTTEVNNKTEVLGKDTLYLTTEELYEPEEGEEFITKLRCHPPPDGRLHITVVAKDCFSSSLHPSLL